MIVISVQTAIAEAFHRLEERRVEIRLAHVGSRDCCPDRVQSCGLPEHAEERRWQHLDTLRFTAELIGLPCGPVQTIRNRAVARGLQARKATPCEVPPAFHGQGGEGAQSPPAKPVDVLQLPDQ